MTVSRAFPILLALLLAAPGARPAAAQRWVSVDVGSQFTCALDSRGRAFCWGINHHGELGARTPERCGPGHHGEGQRCWAAASDTPVAVGGGHTFRVLGAGGTRACGLDPRGRAWCWGKDVGAKTAGCAGGSVCSFDPVPFAPELVFRSVRVGEDGVCGITVEGAGHCRRPGWGADRRWRATTVAPGERLARVDQHGDWMSRDEQVICAVTEDGRALCQGENRNAQLGAGDTLPRAGAARVAWPGRIAEVRPWDPWGCALTAEGSALCWGASQARPSWPGGTPARPGELDCGTSFWCSGPRVVARGLRFTALTFVRERFCGVTRSGEVHCWGIDGVPERAAAGVRFTSLDGGETHACGLTREGAVWCWGPDVDDDETRPVRAPDPPK